LPTAFSSLIKVSITLPSVSKTFIITLLDCGIENLILVVGLNGFGKLSFNLNPIIF